MSDPLSEQQLTEMRTLLAGAPAAKDELIKSIAEAYRDRREHDHPKHNEDWFCTNLAGWMGDRMPVVLSRLLDAEAEVERLRAERSERHDDLVHALGRDGSALDWSELVDVATTAMRRAELLGNASLVVHHCVNPAHPKWIAARTDRRGCPWCRLAELERMQQPVAQTVFLADYDGADDGPKLFASLEAAQSWVAEWSTGDGPWDWFEQDGVWEQWACDRDSDRPTSRGSGTVTPLTMAGAETGLALPWASAMPDDDLHLFLGDLASAAISRWQSDPDVPDRDVLAVIEKACAGWRTPGEGYRSDESEAGESR